MLLYGLTLEWFSGKWWTGALTILVCVPQLWYLCLWEEMGKLVVHGDFWEAEVKKAMVARDRALDDEGRSVAFRQANTAYAHWHHEFYLPVMALYERPWYKFTPNEDSKNSTAQPSSTIRRS